MTTSSNVSVAAAASKEEKSAMFKAIGLGDLKVEETLKNEPLSNLLYELVISVSIMQKASLL